MKNIHVLPTDKPSRLYLNTKEYIFEKEYSLSTDECQNKHIYITSDEEIKANEWFYSPNTNSPQVYGHSDIPEDRGFKKIILTTDQDLIKDGVQPIDDEFLEWFIKYPSCEKVEFEKEHDDTVPYLKMRYVKPYKIIIPKENQKQHLIDMMKADEELGLYEEPKQETILEQIDQNNPVTRGSTALVYKQETLEEVAETHTFNFYEKEDREVGKQSFIEGAKWQQEQMYSEEELLQILESHKDNLEFDKDGFEHDRWFEQFKKK